MREYNRDIHMRLKQSDIDKIRRRMDEAGIRNMSAYMRKMAIDGFVVNLDLSDVKELVRLLRYCSNNINQYAKKANESGDIFKSDIDDIKRRQDRLWNMANEIMERLAAIL
ncbi:MAG: plasmid mobilization relaxosome protein MobC [Lachnospiraceae bacterium]|nr:plasmid mobilization relaxosome protein MobC [Lachnospiraceae bacterium]